MNWHEGFGIYVATFLVCLAGGFLPIGNAELYVGTLAAMSGRGAVVPLAIAATAGQMIAKTIIFILGRGLSRLPKARDSERMRVALERARAWRGPIEAFVFVSAVFSIPPFSIVTLVGGALELGVARFIIVGSLGRLIRFLAIAGGASAVAG